MHVFTSESEVVTVIPPAKLFKACILDGDNLFPRIAPQAFKSVEYIRGNDEPGSIKRLFLEKKVEALDKENFVYSYSVIEVVALMNKLEKITYEIKLEPSPSGGSICKNTSKYYTIGEFEIKEEGIMVGKQKTLGMFKAIEVYLPSNPDVYGQRISILR